MVKIKDIEFKEVENILHKLGYFELEFSYYDRETKTIWYEGYLDTEYRIQIKLVDEDTLEIWDCDYYVDNFVRAGIAKRNNEGIWGIVEG